MDVGNSCLVGMLSTADLFQWLALSVSGPAIIISIFYSHIQVRAARIESGLNAFFKNSERYHSLLFTLLDDDGDVLKNDQDELPRKARFKIYQIIELFSEIYDMREHLEQLGRNVWNRWEQRMGKLMKKPAFRYSWLKQSRIHQDLYSANFRNYVDSLHLDPSQKDSLKRVS